MIKGAVRITQCGNMGELPIIATKTINIPGVIQVQRGQQVLVCEPCYHKVTR